MHASCMHERPRPPGGDVRMRSRVILLRRYPPPTRSQGEPFRLSKVCSRSPPEVAVPRRPRGERRGGQRGGRRTTAPPDLEPTRRRAPSADRRTPAHEPSHSESMRRASSPAATPRRESRRAGVSRPLAGCPGPPAASGRRRHPTTRRKAPRLRGREQFGGFMSQWTSLRGHESLGGGCGSGFERARGHRRARYDDPLQMPSQGPGGTVSVP